MGFDLEGKNKKEVKEISEINENTEIKSETEESSENFEDCFLKETEVKEAKEQEEESEENFEDCELKAGENDEISNEAEEDEDFEDCFINESSDETPTLSEVEKEPIEEKENEQIIATVEVSEKDNTPRDVSKEIKLKTDEKNALEESLKNKFDEVLSKEKGTEEYKTVLGEYNDLMDQKSEIDGKLDELQKEQELRDKINLELREAQIDKGKEAVENSAATMTEAYVLDERYKSSYYEPSPDKTDLANIREDSIDTIKELKDEKQSIKLAMDAKMDEISDYVIDNNMTPDDTENDVHYNKLSEEYTEMKDAHSRTEYAVTMLDENNKSITEVLGDEYISMAEMPKGSEIQEVREGRDNPKETDYFVDRDRADEVLSPFKQESWEQLTVKEQKQAVEDLADYNADILGVEDKPNIVYYHVEDSTDYGGYSEAQNSIFINEYNMDDAQETADTISHEYRHKYQHERANKLENQRDLEFKEGFENYISPEDDYLGYKEQLVEADARDYADAVKNEIDTYPAEKSEATLKDLKDEDFTQSYSELNPEKGSVFDASESSEAYEDFDKKSYKPMSDLAIEKYQEAGISLDEVNRIREISNGKKPDPSTYLEKAYIDRHLDKFRDSGCYKIISDRRGEPSGTIGDEAVFVLSGQEVEQLIDKANGDPRVIEQALAMEEGYLGNNPYIIRVDNPENLRMPTGNESNAWEDEWCPCGTTRGGYDEALIDPVKRENYSYKRCFGDDGWK